MGSMLTGAEGAESVSLVRVPLSFTVQPISPADSSGILMWPLLATANNCEIFSLLPVRVFYQLRCPESDPAANDAEIGDLADMLFDLALEYERHGGCRLVGGDLLALGREETRSLQRAGVPR